jgi:hypothetical protein
MLPVTPIWGATGQEDLINEIKSETKPKPQNSLW